MAEYGGEGLRIETFARLLFDQWQVGIAKLGDQNWNTGILVLVSVGDRKARIELGAGWGREKDQLCQQIMDERMVPRFKQGDFSGGITAGVEALEAMARGKELPTVPRPWWHYALVVGVHRAGHLHRRVDDSPRVERLGMAVVGRSCSRLRLSSVPVPGQFQPWRVGGGYQRRIVRRRIFRRRRGQRFLVDQSCDKPANDFSDEQRRAVAQAVAEAEGKTSAEIVPVVATASGRYDRAEDIVGLWTGHHRTDRGLVVAAGRASGKRELGRHARMGHGC